MHDNRPIGVLMRRLAAPFVVGVLAVVAAGLVSCSTVKRTVVAPPSIPGAKYVGSKSCADCHETLVAKFAGATHESIKAEGSNSLEIGCESCHGPGSVHADAGGGRDNIFNPGKSPESCFQCHLEMRGRFSLPSHHPVAGGKMSCSDCHNPHQGSAMRGGGTQLTSESDNCKKCHLTQHGPFVFEHEAMREGCTTCHNPHGSVNAKMLTERNSSLCLKCHFQQQTSPGDVRIGGISHGSFLARGTCWSAGCHEAVHGSKVNSSLRY